MTEDHYIALLEARNRELAKAHEVLKRVRELHREGPHQTCVVCATWQEWSDGSRDLIGVPYPCPTVQALDGAS